MSRKVALPDLADLYRLYEAGESTVDLARRFGCHSSTLRNRFKRAGLALRDSSDAHRVEASRLTAEERSRRAAAAHDAVRGKRRTTAELVKRAARREQRGVAKSVPEQEVERALVRLGLAPKFQRACGPYNIDFAIGDAIAVEVFGGGWHANGRHAARHPERTRYLLNRGFDVVVVWIEAKYGRAWVRALDEVITDLQRPGRDPAAPRQYRVIWGRGELLALSADSDHFPLKPATEVRRNASGRYERAR